MSSEDGPMQTTITGNLNYRQFTENFKDLIIQKDKPSTNRSAGQFIIDKIQMKDSREKEKGKSKVLYFQMVMMTNARGEADEKGFNETIQKYELIKFTLKTTEDEKVVIDKINKISNDDPKVNNSIDFLSINNPIYNDVQEQLKNLKISRKAGEDARLNDVDPTTNMNVKFDGDYINSFKIHDPSGNVV